MYSILKPAIGCLFLASGSSVAIQLNVNDTTSVKSAAKIIVDNIMSTYNGSESGQIPGLFQGSYYWWESGLVWDSLIHYWAQTGDDTYNDLVNEAMSWQVGSNNDYLPTNQTKTIGNDDQSFWALAAMTAAEQGFPAPIIGSGAESNVTWAQLAINVFNSQAARWDDQTCGGGLRWQIFAFNTGYSYKNSLSNGNFYQLASRLALYTGNSSYSDWAERVLIWSFELGLLNNVTGAVFDGFDSTTNCSTLNHLQWTADTGTYLSGAAYIQNYSTTLENSGPPFLLIINLNDTFTRNLVLYEVACEASNNCNTDQLAFKAIASRGLAKARDLTPISNFSINGTRSGTIQEHINSIIQASAQGAAAQCSGGDNGTICGSSWLNSTWDGRQGLGQDVSALEIILATLPGKAMLNANSSAPVASTNSSTNSNTTASPTQPGAASATSSGANNLHSSLVGLVLAIGFAILLCAE